VRASRNPPSVLRDFAMRPT